MVSCLQEGSSCVTTNSCGLLNSSLGNLELSLGSFPTVKQGSVFSYTGFLLNVLRLQTDFRRRKVIKFGYWELLG